MRNFEKQARERLTRYSSPFDEERLWDGIDRQLRPRSKRRLAIWWWIGAMGLLTCAGLLWWPTTSNVQLPDKPPSEETASQYGIFALTSGEMPLSAVTDSIAKIAIEQPDKVPVRVVHKAPPVLSAQSKAVAVSIPDLRTLVVQMDTLTGLPFVALPLPDQKPTVSEVSATPYSVRTPSRWSISIFGGLHYPFKTLSTKDPSYSVLRTERLRTESVLEAWQVGAAVQRQLNQHWRLEAGVEYFQINELFQRNDFVRAVIDSTMVYDFMINSGGDTSFFGRMAPIIQTMRKEQVIYNHYRLLQLPVAVSRVWPIHARGAWYVKAGAMIHLGFEQAAEMMVDPVASARFDSKQPVPEYPFRRALWVNPMIGLGGSYAVHPRWHVFGEVQYRYFIPDFSSKTYGLRQRYQTLGLTAGIQFRL